MGGFPALEVIAALIAQLPGPQVDAGPCTLTKVEGLVDAQERIVLLARPMHVFVNGERAHRICVRGSPLLANDPVFLSYRRPCGGAKPGGTYQAAEKLGIDLIWSACCWARTCRLASCTRRSALPCSTAQYRSRDLVPSSDIYWGAVAWCWCCS